MILNIYSMRDKLTGYSQPTFELYDAVAMRNFEHAVMAAQGLFKTHPEDFDLYHLGVFDTETGIISGGADSPRLVLAGSSVVLHSLQSKEV